MRREDVEAAIALAEKATPGAWEPEYEGYCWVYNHGQTRIIAHCEVDLDECAGYDARFIAESRTLIPALAKALLDAWDRAAKADAEVARFRALLVEQFVFEMVQEPMSESGPVISDGWSCGACGGTFDKKELVEHDAPECPLYAAKEQP